MIFKYVLALVISLLAIAVILRTVERMRNARWDRRDEKKEERQQNREERKQDRFWNPDEEERDGNDSKPDHKRRIFWRRQED